MAEDLDDGELWLPSDIFPEVGLRRRLHRLPPSSAAAARSADLAVLARQLAALGLLDPPHHSLPSFKTAPSLPVLHYAERFAPAARFEPVERELGPALAYDGYQATPLARSAGSTGFTAGSRPVYLNQRKPSQAESFALWRARVLQRSQSTGPNRSFPVRAAGSGRQCGGTGVFLPRVAHTDVKKKPAMKSGEQQQKQQPMRSAVIGRQGMSFQLPQSEMGLPHDWTY